MIVSDAGVFGNVSGGCVEGAVYERCLEAIDSGAVSVDSFGYSDGEGLAAGLTCGGAVDVLVRPVPPGGAAAAQLALLAERDAAGIPTRFRLVTSGALRGTGVVEHGTAAASGRMPRTPTRSSSRSAHARGSSWWAPWSSPSRSPDSVRRWGSG
jgi:xanthine dehydrogenase accessory factor